MELLFALFTLALTIFLTTVTRGWLRVLNVVSSCLNAMVVAIHTWRLF